ncbi:uncharacterized protein LOC132611097 [Lycium barbarum]|uniref:uncharacterized protein LOC132611097 n=1 Tax=Lycium barbarum TaxID=112863 RepID=UPI00293E7061|nr:uncharacterized protein LOC132611097 [Lycium barbarum]
MAAQSNFISEINTKPMNWRLKVRIVRLWEKPLHNKPDSPFSTELILMDENGGRIHASVGRNIIQSLKTMNQEIKELGLYIMKNFMVCPNKEKLRTKDHKCKLIFTQKTIVEEIQDPYFDMCIFKFRPYEQLSNPQDFDDIELFGN